jgi:hypothetical protein
VTCQVLGGHAGRYNRGYAGPIARAASYGSGNGVEAKADRGLQCESSTLNSVLGDCVAAVVDGE